MSWSFYALLARLKNIDRWALMRNADRENVMEHSHMVAVLAHALAVIRRDVLGVPCSPDRCAAAALFHDATEIFTGDMPTPVKYHDEEMRLAYRRVEAVAVKKLMAGLPEAMRPEYASLLKDEGGVRDIVKAADTLAAYIKCLEELKTGNMEFKSAAGSTLQKLKGMGMAEVDYFLDNFIQGFEKTLDEISI